MEAYALTDVGRVRRRNQDYIYSSSEPVGSLDNLFLVADGMGATELEIMHHGLWWKGLILILAITKTAQQYLYF